MDNILLWIIMQIHTNHELIGYVETDEYVHYNRLIFIRAHYMTAGRIQAIADMFSHID